LLIAGNAATRRDTELAASILRQALSLSQAHQLPVWQVRTLAELGLVERSLNSDPRRFYEARERAAAAGMAGMVARMDFRIGGTESMRKGWVAAYPAIVRADAQARQLRLTFINAQTRIQLANCLVHADGHHLPGRTHSAAPSEVDDLIAEALALGEKSTPVPWARGVLATRAWFHGDSSTAIQLFEESLRYARGEIQQLPWWGMYALIRIVSGINPDEAFGPDELTGHHANWAARAYGDAVHEVRNGRSPTGPIGEADDQLRHAPFLRHFLRTIIAPVVFEADMDTTVGWLREADAFCAAAGERALQHRVRHALGTIGAKVPRTAARAVPPHLARLGITARETEVLRLVNAGFSNTDIAGQLFLSVRTVESHISSMLQKTGQNSRELLPLATVDDS